MIYLDYAATTPLDPRVAEAMHACRLAYFGNPSSAHAAGRAARAALDEARDMVAACLGARSAEIIFTSGGTEADNLAIKGVALAYRHRGNHLVTSAIEHHAVLESCRALEHDGFQITYLRPDARGLIAPEQVAEALTSKTTLVSIMAANNEIGAIQPIEAIGAVCRERGVLFHTDAVQGVGELPFDLGKLPVDLLSLSAHKIYGPPGVGALYLRTGTRLSPQMHGGQQEFGRRAGTESLVNIIGLATALTLAQDRSGLDRIRQLRDLLLAEIGDLPGFRVHGDLKHRLAGNANIAFAGTSGEKLLIALDLRGICVSTGAACAAGSAEASHVIRALGYNYQQSLEAIRLTLGRHTTEEEIHQTATALRDIVGGNIRGGAQENTEDTD